MNACNDHNSDSNPYPGVKRRTFDWFRVMGTAGLLICSLLVERFERVLKKEARSHSRMPSGDPSTSFPIKHVYIDMILLPGNQLIETRPSEIDQVQ